MGKDFATDAEGFLKRFVNNQDKTNKTTIVRPHFCIYDFDTTHQKDKQMLLWKNGAKAGSRFVFKHQTKETMAEVLLARTDDKRISEINMVSGRTKKRTPKLYSLLNNVVTMGTSSNGMWLCGVLLSGELFMWNRDKDLLKTTTTVPEVANFISAVQGSATKLTVQAASDGMRVLLAAVTGQVFLWQCTDARELMGIRDCTLKGKWTQIQPTDDTLLPTSKDKEASIHSIFVRTEALGDVCFSTFVFTSGKKLVITCLKIYWGENQEKIGSVSYSVRWATKTFLMSSLKPPCQPVKSRGALVPAFSPDGQLLAVVLNQRQPQATQVLFVSTVNFVSVSRCLGGCGCRKRDIPSKYIRSYWVGSVSWSAGGLFLACVLKRGSLLVLVRLGGLLTLSSSGCNIDFGPAHFLPLHPLVTYRPTVSVGKGEASLSSSSLSVRDVMRQRYSVTWHPRLFYFIVSDGYMATVVRVLDRTPPTLLLSTLLKDITKDIEKATQLLDKSQKHMRMWLDSVSGLNLERSLEELSPTATYRPNTTSTDRSALPYFLQDQGTMGKELLETVQNFFEDDSDLDGVPVGSHVADGGRLEFASMFDTLHALDTRTPDPFLDTDSDQDTTLSGRKIAYELEKIQNNLLTALAFGMSLGSYDEHKSPLLKHALKCAVRFAALLHIMPNSMVHSENAAVTVLDFLKPLLSFNLWERANSDRPQSYGLMVEFCSRLVQLILTPYNQSYQCGVCQISSRNLSIALKILQVFSESLNHSYRLQQRAIWSSVQKEPSDSPQIWPLDLHSVPLLQDEEKENFEHGTWPGLVQPSRRLYGVWRWVYTITQQYMEELQKFKGYENWEEEMQRLVEIMSKIQTVLQSSGERLEDDHGLVNYTGEHLFLSGFYSKSTEVWRSQLWEESRKIGQRSVFQEKRLCLALLYSLLSQYQLKEAQELGDHMACLIQQTDDRQKHSNTSYKEYCECSWLPTDLSRDTAVAVVQSLGRFMASYFSNQTLFILPAHSVDVLPPIHLPHASSVGRLVPLCQKEIAKAVRQQQLSEIWTVEYAQDLLLLGGLLPECVWLAYHLGDWKAALSLSLGYTHYCSQHFDLTCIQKRELHLPKDLEPASILQAELKCLLSNNDDASKGNSETNANKSFTDPIDEEDWGLLQDSIQDILKASVMAGVDVVSSPLSALVDTAKDLCSCLTAMVPTGLYLPSPPLYCPQPSPNTQDPVGTMGYLTEVTSRHKVSGVLQKLLLLLRSAHCCYPAAQWYLSQLRRARHILHKMKKRYAYANASAEEKAFPDSLLKFINKSGYFRQKLKNDSHMDPGTIQTIICFRELCGLCWMLHVRDQLSISCRKYQADRQQAKQDQFPSEVTSTCVDALQWARRFLPFTRFLNCEEIIQDTLLSLLSELPPVSLVADTLVQAFPEELESIRVPLREKYNILTQTLRQCNVTDAENEIMMVLIQDKLRLRKKHLGRLRRHLATPELHLWEKEMEEEDGASKHGMAMLRQLSLGTSLSTSTLTDCGLLTLHSDGDTTENISEAPVSPDLQNTTRVSKSRITGAGDGLKTALRIENVIKEEGPSGDAKVKDNEPNMKQPTLPSVGSWEFELEDEEYLHFLELFLSYVLEKDTVDGSSHELPLLKDFSHKFRERELHSLTFDVLTTMHQRMKALKNPEPPVFRAGCCFRPMTQDTTQKTPTSKSSRFQNQISVESFQKGLFGQRKQHSELLKRSIKSSHFDSKTSPTRSAFPIKDSSVRLCSIASVESVMELKQGLDAKLESRFPELGRLLEWMMRWADRRQRGGGKKRNKGEETGETVDDGVVIRVKASAPAVLTSLSLMEHRYNALLGTDRYIAHIHIPQTQWNVAPVLEPTADRKVEGEGSVDTGYPASTNTPTIVLDHNIQHEALSVGSCSGEPQELTLSRAHLVQVENQPQSEISTPVQALSSQSHENLTHENKVNYTDSNDSGDSSSVSSEISCTPGTSLKLADLDSQNVSRSALQLLKPSPHPQPKAFSTDKSEKVVHKETASTVHSSDLTPEPPSPQPTPDAPPTSVSFPPDQQSGIQPLQMRQRLGEDLYRLVQNINYVSLMEVLGASFSNLQLAQQNSLLTQPSLNSNPNAPSSSFLSNILPQPNAQYPVQTSMGPRFQSVQPNPGSHFTPFTHVSQHSPAVHPNANINVQRTGGPVLPGVGISGQEMHPLSVQAESPELEARNLIPCSEGLLTTTDFKPTVHKAPILLPSCSSMQNDSPPILSGLRLLQFRPPQVANYGSRHGPQIPQNNHESSHSRFKYNEQRGLARSQVNIISEQQPIQRSSYGHHQMSERFREQEPSLLLQCIPVQTTSTPQGLRLLNVQPVSSSNITLPHIPVKTFSKPSPAISVPIGETPRIKLLHVESQQKIMMPLQASFSQSVRLMPAEDLRITMSRMQIVDDNQVQMLTVERSANDTQKSASLRYSNMRQKRREKLRKTTKTEVTFRPNNSIIRQKATNDLPNEEAKVSKEVTKAQDISLLPGSLLKGDELVEKAIATAAELHAFASTCKRPPECHDVFTNTDPESYLIVEDKAVSAQVSNTASSPKSPGLRKEQVCKNEIVQDKEDLQLSENTNLILYGREFISVVDLEDKSLHQDLTPSHNNQPLFSEVTTAQLHVMATDVLRNAHDSQTSHDDPFNAQTSPTAIPYDSVSLGHFEFEKVGEYFAADLSECEAKICGAIKSQVSHSGSTQQPTFWFSSQMSQLDAQLSALQRIADSLETDISNSRMLVNRIEKLTPVQVSQVKTAVVKKSVRLRVPHEKWKQEVPTTEPAFCDQEEQSTLDSHIFEEKSSVFSTKMSLTADISDIQTPPRRRLDSEISDILADEDQEQTGLSDTVEMLDQLVREGFLSPTDLDWTTPSTRHQNSLEHGQKGKMSQKRVHQEDERKELRTWMRRKQRERLAVYQKHRQSLREMEHRPFSSSGTVKLVNKKGKSKEEHHRILDHYTQRTLEACNLASDISVSPPVISGFTNNEALSRTYTTRPSTAPPSNSTYRVYSPSVRPKSQSGQTKVTTRPKTAVTNEPSSNGYRKRLGIDRPVTALPRDRLSQLTRRGMVTDLSSPKLNSGHDKMKSPSRPVAVGKEFQMKETRNPSRPSETYRVYKEDYLDNSQEDRDSAIPGEKQWDWLDYLSETGSSNLSKIDWAVIERMVAEET